MSEGHLFVLSCFTWENECMLYSTCVNDHLIQAVSNLHIKRVFNVTLVISSAVMIIQGTRLFFCFVFFSETGYHCLPLQHTLFILYCVQHIFNIICLQYQIFGDIFLKKNIVMNTHVMSVR